MAQIIQKECPSHGLTDFYVFKKKDRNSFYHKCKKCNVEAVDRKRKKLKRQAIEYKGGACNLCKYSKCNSALEFHHLDPKEKDFAIGTEGYTRSWDKIKIELDKCILVCANCHREIHAKEHI
jgi:hypothetical protein